MTNRWSNDRSPARPGIRHRTSRPSSDESSKPTVQAACHRSSGATVLSQRCATRIDGEGSQWSRSTIDERLRQIRPLRRVRRRAASRPRDVHAAVPDGGVGNLSRRAGARPADSRGQSCTAVRSRSIPGLRPPARSGAFGDAERTWLAGWRPAATGQGRASASAARTTVDQRAASPQKDRQSAAGTVHVGHVELALAPWPRAKPMEEMNLDRESPELKSLFGC